MFHEYMDKTLISNKFLIKVKQNAERVWRPVALQAKMPKCVYGEWRVEEPCITQMQLQGTQTDAETHL
jgi:hypothetical protein